MPSKIYVREIFLVLQIASYLIESSDSAPEKFSESEPFDSIPLCLTRPFLQSELRYGNLVRKYHSNGKLVFMDGIDPTENLEVFLRLHPDKRSENTAYSPYDVPSASSLSFARTLDELTEKQRNQTFISILLNGIGEGEGERERERELTSWLGWVEYLFKNRTQYQTYICPTGNVASYNCMLDLAREHMRTNANSNDTIYYFVEDDYLHLPSATSELIEVFRSHDPCFAVPYDYADRYMMPQDINIDDGRVTVIAGRRRHWRSVSSITVTFATRGDAFSHFRYILPHPLNDFHNSLEITRLNGSIIAPLPSLASHIENYYYFDHRTQFISLYHDWHAMGRDLVEHIHTLSVSLYNTMTRNIEEEDRFEL
mmetsp:Transcript_11604/g.11626  ORF Transcript_11604/g.11626 Transcript_11604/m.11626 type:complete len:369 (+) Transcript_11604:102-1208(+)